jgi:hypothetical protein
VDRKYTLFNNHLHLTLVDTFDQSTSKIALRWRGAVVNGHRLTSRHTAGNQFLKVFLSSPFNPFLSFQNRVFSNY